MGILSEPRPGGGGGRLRAALALVAALVVVGAALWVFVRPRAGERKAPPAAPRARSTPSPRPTPLPSAIPGTRATPRPRTGARPEAAAPAPTLRVDSDVPGANVFLDRKFLGTTPVETTDFVPGEHRLNVSAEGYEMYGEPVQLTAGPNEVVVKFKAVRLDERLDVVHKHGVGSCKGRLVATPAGLSFEAREGRRFVPGASLLPRAAPAGLPQEGPAREAEGREDLELHIGRRRCAARLPEGRRGRPEEDVSSAPAVTCRDERPIPEGLSPRARRQDAGVVHAAGGALHGRVPGPAREAHHARGVPHAGAGRRGDPAAPARVRVRRRHPLLGPPPSRSPPWGSRSISTRAKGP